MWLNQLIYFPKTIHYLLYPHETTATLATMATIKHTWQTDTLEDYLQTVSGKRLTYLLGKNVKALILNIICICGVFVLTCAFKGPRFVDYMTDWKSQTRCWFH